MPEWKKVKRKEYYKSTRNEDRGFLNILEKMTNIEIRPRSSTIQVIKVPEEENQSKRTRQILRTIIQEKLLLKRFETTYWKNLPRS